MRAAEEIFRITMMGSYIAIRYHLLLASKICMAHDVDSILVTDTPDVFCLTVLGIQPGNLVSHEFDCSSELPFRPSRSLSVGTT